MLLDTGGYGGLAPYALYWRDQGITPIPIVFRGKYPSVPWKQWVGRMPPELLVKAWFGSKKRVNLGLLLENGLTVLDFDQIGSYLNWRKVNPQLAETRTHLSARGAHVWFRLHKPPQRTGAMVGGDIKVTGVVVAPPSIHPTGKEYRTLTDRPIQEAESVSDLGIIVVEREVQIHYNANSFAPQYGVLGENPVARIKQMIPILDWIARLTTPYQVSQRQYMATCPFHQDRNPSLGIWPTEACCYCFSPACRAHKKSDVINCAQYHYGVSVQEAIKLLIAETYI